MKISVLVPVYNVADKIERCAVSLMEQTYDDIEYIFVDDCTPDDSIDVLRLVIERYPKRKSQITILHNERNLRQAGTRNRLLDAATGDCVMFVDSDDYLHPEACHRLLSMMCASGADIVTGAYVSLLSGGKEMLHRPVDCGKNQQLRTQLCFSLTPSHLWARLYRRSLWTEHNIRAVEGINLAEDYMLVNRLMLHARLANIDDVVYYYDEIDVRNICSLYPGHIEQQTRSVEMVENYYAAHAPSYLIYLQMAYLHVVRTAALYGLDATNATKHLRCWTLPIACLLRNKRLRIVGNILYKTVRRLLLIVGNVADKFLF